MSTSDIHRVQPAAPASPIGSRAGAADRFEQALRREAQDNGQRQSGGDPDADRGGDGARRAVRPPELHGRSLPTEVMRLLQASLQRSPTAGAGQDGADDDVLDALLRDIADGVSAGRHLPGSRWRLLVRLRHDLLPSTEVEISSVESELAIVLRTSDENAYRAIVEALPRLNRSLQRRQIAGGSATVFLVASKDLQ